MKSIAKGIIVIICTVIGLQLIAEKLDFSTAYARTHVQADRSHGNID